MQKQYGTVFKSGNSFAIRVPMAWAEAHGLKEGDRLKLPTTPQLNDESSQQEGRTYVTPPDPSRDAPGDPMPEWD